MDEETINTLEGNAQDLPEEVRDFLFGEEFEQITNELASLVASNNQKIDLPSEVMLLVLGVRSKDEMISYISSLATTPENKEKIKQIIQEKVIDEILLSIQIAMESEGAGTISTAEQPATSNTSVSKKTDSLTSLADRLKQSSFSATATRDYTLQKGIVPQNLPVTEEAPVAPKISEPMDTISEPIAPSAPAAAPQTPLSKSFDPYHESIDR